MNFISNNINYLVLKEGIGKDQFGKLFNLNRGVIGSYIANKSTPKLDTLQSISKKYDILIDDLVNKDISVHIENEYNTDKKCNLYDFSEEEIIKHLYIEDEKFSKNPLFWMYIKMKSMDDKIKIEEEALNSIKEKKDII